jgi:hypothetical protein
MVRCLDSCSSVQPTKAYTGHQAHTTPETGKLQKTSENYRKLKKTPENSRKFQKIQVFWNLDLGRKSLSSDVFQNSWIF